MSDFALNNLNKTTEKKKRVGRGLGSGTGTTAGRGDKGQKARSGSSVKGQRANFARLFPKIGFNTKKDMTSVIHLDRLLDLVHASTTDAVSLNNSTIKDIMNVKKNRTIKITLGKCEEETQYKCDNIEFIGIAMSQSAKDAILSNGGKVS
jgi:large subunit ribosomal protein L15